MVKCRNAYIVLFSTLCVCALACNSKRDPNATISSPVVAVALQRSGHSLLGPSYKVTLKKDGVVTYVGSRNVSRIGTYEARLNPRDFGFLVDAIDGLHFLATNNTAALNDTDRIEVSVSIAERNDFIRYGCWSDTPVELWTIGMTIDGIVANITDWKRTE
jgi:hypothetical protein